MVFRVTNNFDFDLQVPVGVQLRNENKLDEMFNYRAPDKIHLPDGDTIQGTKINVWEILFGGDQLTRARANGAAIQLKSRHDDVKEWLCGLIPVIEDWHTWQTVFICFIYRLFGRDCTRLSPQKRKNTLYQL